MARRIADLLLVIVLLGGLQAAGAWAEEAKAPKEDYYELHKILVDTLDQVERNYVKDVSRRELIEAAIEGVLEKLDPYSAYINPEDMSRFRSSVESEFGGIGIQISVDAGQLKILSPLPDTPADRAGLLAGDHILQIDGASSEGINLDEAVRRLKGKEGTKVTLTVVHPGSHEKEEITITREKIHIDTVLGDHRKKDRTWDFILDSDRHIAYVRVAAFSRDTAGELRKVLGGLQKDNLRGLILDLRFNPGGLLNSAIEVSDLFVSKGSIVSTKGRNTPERVWEAQEKGTCGDFPMVVLINRYSASASEIVSACLQDHKRAVVVGERSWGKGSVQNVIELEDGRSALKLTTAAYRRPSGKNIHRFPGTEDSEEWGVRPDEGFELKLGDEEMKKLLRHRRDSLIPPADGQPQAKPDPTDNKPTEENADSAPGEGKPDAQQQQPSPPDGSPDSPGEPNGDSTPKARQGEFVDRQLQMAVDYLGGELARAD